jgi:7 transmembrane receptor (rhodopsin family)
VCGVPVDTQYQREMAYYAEGSDNKTEICSTGQMEADNSSAAASTWEVLAVSGGVTLATPQAIPALSILLGVALFLVVFISAAANMFVLLSYAYEKKLRTTFSILIANLAVTDFIVAVIPMNFYTINIMYGYWPLGKVLCGLWVVVDYNTVFASTYSLAAISVDRLWSIKWSIHYRQHNTKRKAAVTVAIVWYVCGHAHIFYLRFRQRRIRFSSMSNKGGGGVIKTQHCIGSALQLHSAGGGYRT